MPGDRPQCLERVIRLRPSGVVGVALGRPDDALLVNDEAGRDGQRPRRITVELLEVQRKRAVDLTQIIRELEAQPELSGHLVAAIGQDLEREMTGADQLTVVLGQLRGDSDQRGA